MNRKDAAAVSQSRVPFFAERRKGHLFRGGFRIIFSLQKAFAEAVARSSYLNPVYQEMAGGHITDFYRAHI